MANLHISHVAADAQFAHALKAALAARGHSISRIDQDRQKGVPLQQSLLDHLADFDAIVMVLSPDAAGSPGMTFETGAIMTYARHRGKPVVIPVAFSSLDVRPPLSGSPYVVVKDKDPETAATVVDRLLAEELAKYQVSADERREAEERVERTAATGPGRPIATAPAGAVTREGGNRGGNRMSKVFISYNRQSEAMARILVDDVEALGYIVWFDQELSGGQSWWDHILGVVRDCDVFVFLLDPKSLTSTACKREFGYAADLGKPILPVLVAEGVSTNLLPPDLSRLQFIDYRKQDRSTALSLARALASIPPSKPLPDPLPPAPEVPISYLGSLTQKIDKASALSYEEQSALMADLRRSLRDPEAASDTRTLLERLRDRRDLFATIAEEIDDLLGSPRRASSLPGRTSAPARPVIVDTPQQTVAHPRPAATETWIPPKWPLGTFVGAAVGAVLGVIAAFIDGHPSEWWAAAGIVGTVGAITGAITGTRRRVIAIASVGLILGFTGWVVAVRDTEGFIQAIAFGAPIGALLGAIVGRIGERKRWLT